jgi:hypothetical protein
MRDQAVRVMAAGYATPGEIAKAMGWPITMVEKWRHRAGIMTEPLRLERVKKLMEYRRTVAMPDKPGD